MPRFIMFMYPGVNDEDWEPSVEAVEAMMKYNEELTKAGVVLALDGLHPPSKGARVKFSGGTPTVVDGPFAEAKEVVGGYWIIQAKDRQEAVEWARRCPAGPDEEFFIEVRQIQELSDFPEEIQAVAQLSEEPPEQTSAR